MKVTYVLYLGWFDGTLASPPGRPLVDPSTRYVAFMGGAKSVLKKAKDSFDKGDYRWVGEVLNHVVFADSKNRTASEVPIPPVRARGRCYEAPSTYLFGFVAGIGGRPRLRYSGPR